MLLISGQERTRQVAHLWQLVAVGLGSGVVVRGGNCKLKMHEPASIGLWLSGPIEETLKLLVPFALLVARRCALSRSAGGSTLVMLSGAVFGFTEVYGALGEEIFVIAVARSFGEWFTSCSQGSRAAVIWLAAWRAGRAWTYAGALRG